MTILHNESGHIGPFGKLAYSRINKRWVPCHLCDDGTWAAIPRQLLPGEEKFLHLMLGMEGKTEDQLKRMLVQIFADYEGMCGREADSFAFAKFVGDIVLKLWEEK